MLSLENIVVSTKYSLIYSRTALSGQFITVGNMHSHFILSSDFVYTRVLQSLDYKVSCLSLHNQLWLNSNSPVSTGVYGKNAFQVGKNGLYGCVRSRTLLYIHCLYRIDT